MPSDLKKNSSDLKTDPNSDHDVYELQVYTFFLKSSKLTIILKVAEIEMNGVLCELCAHIR